MKMVGHWVMITVLINFAYGRYAELIIDTNYTVANVPAYLTIFLYEDDGSSVTAEIDLTVSCSKADPSSQSFTYNKDSNTREIKFISTGNADIKISGISKVSPASFYVNPLQLNFTQDFTSSKGSQNTNFPLIVVVLNPRTNEVETENNYTITLKLQCVTKCSGKVFKVQTNEPGESYLGTTEYGMLSVGTIRILSSGNFKLIASTPLAKSDATSEIKIQNTVKQINITLNNSTESSNKDVDVSIRLIGDDDNDYISPAEISLDTNFSSYIGESSEITETGYWNFSCYFDHSGSMYFEASTNVSDVTGYNDDLEILPNVLKFSDFSEELPTNTRHTFGFTVTIYDSEGLNVIDDKDPIVVTAFVDDDHSLGGVTSVNSSGGVAEFSDINFDDSGKQKLRVTIGDLNYTYDKTFDIESTDCKVGSGPIASTSVLLFLLLFLSFVFYNTDKGITSYKDISLFFLVYPPTAIIFKSPPIRRITVTILLVTCELLMLTLIGGVYAHFDDTTEHYDKDFTDYYGRILYKGAMGWAIAQIGIIPLFYLCFFSMADKRYLKVFLIVSFIVILLAFGAMVGMTIKFCIGFSQYWTANFLIFLLFDLFVMQVLYSLIAVAFFGGIIRVHEIDKKKPSDVDSESVYSIVSDIANRK